MLDKDPYITHSPYQDKDFDEALVSIAKTIGVSVTNIRALITLIGAYTLYFTHEEWKKLLPANESAYRNRVECRAIPALKEQGLIECKNFTRTIGASKRVFLLTKKGEKEASEVRGGLLTVAFPKKTKDKEKQERIRVHTYCAGMNFFQMLMLRIPFEWEREKVYPEHRKVTAKDLLQADAVCRMYKEGSSRGRTLYIEQDMGTEANATLLQKVVKYERYARMEDTSDLIIFSFFAKEASMSQNHNAVSAYATGRAKRLLAFMEENGCKDVQDALEKGYEDAAYVSVLQETVDAVHRDLGIKDTKIKASFLRNFYEALLSQRNPYQEHEQNRKHLAFSVRKLQDLEATLLKELYHPQPFMERMLMGFQVVCLPTTLFSMRLPYAMLELFPEKRSKMQEVLRPYFGELAFLGETGKSFSVSLRQGSFTYTQTARPRNLFSYRTTEGAQGYLSLEMPFLDFGAWMRVKLLAEGNAENETLSFVCILGDRTQASLFFETIGYIHDDFGITPSACAVYGLLLNEEGVLVTHAGRGMLVDLLPDN